MESEELGGNASEADAVVSTGNTRISIFEDDDGDPCYKVLGKSKWAKNTKWLDQIVEFLNDLQNSVSKYIPNGQIMVHTEHKRDSVVWRAHPNYRGTGQWKDWVMVDWGPGYGVLPAHIWCFVDLTMFNSGTETVEFGGISIKSGTYAVVECAEFDEDTELIAESDIFVPISLEIAGVRTDEDGKRTTIRKFYLADCEAFHGPCSVVPDIGGERNAYLQVKPRREWASIFTDWVKEPHSQDVIDVDLLAEMKQKVEEKRKQKAEKRRLAAEKRASSEN